MVTAAVTMVWNDDFFLKVWLDYFVPQLGAKNVFVFNHGGASSTHDVASEVNVIDLPRDPADLHFDARRWDLLSRFVSGLTGYYDTVLCLDVDELIVPSEHGASIVDGFTDLTDSANYCLPGFDLFPHENADGKNLGTDCAGMMFTPFYSKTCIAKKPINFIPGAHGVRDEAPVLLSKVMLLHLKNLAVTEISRRDAVRKAFAQDAYQASELTRKEILSSSKELAPWINGHRRSKERFEHFSGATDVGWPKLLSESLEQLNSLAVKQDNVYRFRRHPKSAIKSDLPEWMRDLL